MDKSIAQGRQKRDGIEAYGNTLSTAKWQKTTLLSYTN
jgi:hypothetical protein